MLPGSAPNSKAQNAQKSSILPDGGGNSSASATSVISSQSPTALSVAPIPPDLHADVWGIIYNYLIFIELAHFRGMSKLFRRQVDWYLSKTFLPRLTPVFPPFRLAVSDQQAASSSLIQALVPASVGSAASTTSAAAAAAASAITVTPAAPSVGDACGSAAPSTSSSSSSALSSSTTLSSSIDPTTTDPSTTVLASNHSPNRFPLPSSPAWDQMEYSLVRMAKQLQSSSRPGSAHYVPKYFGQLGIDTPYLQVGFVFEVFNAVHCLDLPRFQGLCKYVSTYTNPSIPLPVLFCEIKDFHGQTILDWALALGDQPNGRRLLEIFGHECRKNTTNFPEAKLKNARSKMAFLPGSLDTDKSLTSEDRWFLKDGISTIDRDQIFLQACRVGNLKYVKEYRHHVITPSAKYTDVNTIISETCKADQLEVLKLLHDNVSFPEGFEKLRSIVHEWFKQAVVNGFADIVAWLLQYPQYQECFDGSYENNIEVIKTAVRDALRCGSVLVISLLLEKLDDPKNKDEDNALGIKDNELIIGISSYRRDKKLLQPNQHHHLPLASPIPPSLTPSPASSLAPPLASPHAPLPYPEKAPSNHTHHRSILSSEQKAPYQANPPRALPR